MRHGKKFNHLGRKAAHRKAMLSNMAGSLIEHKRISTTLAKAKALRVYVEPLITKAKSNTVHSRRTAFSKLKNKHVVKELFDTVGPKVGDRPGGYTRIIKMGRRFGDNAEICYIELVDFNEVMLQAKEASGSGKRTRRKKKKSGSTAANTAAAATAVAATDAVVDTAPEVVEETVAETIADTATNAVEKVEETAAEVVDKVEETATDAVETVTETTSEVVEETPAAPEAPAADEPAAEEPKADDAEQASDEDKSEDA